MKLTEMQSKRSDDVTGLLRSNNNLDKKREENKQMARRLFGNSDEVA